MIETKPEELREIFFERLSQMCLMDDELFCAVFDGDIECTQYILRIIMDMDNLMVRSAVVQRVGENLKGRGVRFDVLAEADGVLYNIEVQRSDSGAIPRRARYNSSMLDTSTLNKGAAFNELLETYVIFITENDVLRGDLPIYHIDRMILETGALFGDGAHIIYVNGKNRDDSTLGRLMQDFFSRDPEQMQNSILRERLKFFKGRTKGGVAVSSIMQDIYDQAREEGLSVGRNEGFAVGRNEGFAVGRNEGLALGRTEGVQDVTVSLLKMKQPVEFISEATKLPVEEIIAIGRANGLM